EARRPGLRRGSIQERLTGSDLEPEMVVTMPLVVPQESTFEDHDARRRRRVPKIANQKERRGEARPDQHQIGAIGQIGLGLCRHWASPIAHRAESATSRL